MGTQLLEAKAEDEREGCSLSPALSGSIAPAELCVYRTHGKGLSPRIRKLVDQLVEETKDSKPQASVLRHWRPALSVSH